MNSISFIRDLFHQPYFVCLLAIITCACYYYLRSEKATQKKIVWTIYCLLSAGAFLIFIASAIYRIYHPEVWDFTAFYLYGKVAAQGYNYYSTESFHAVYHSLNLPFTAESLGGFMNSVVNVGFPYPPPTILYFVPLGYLSFKTALIVWTVFNLFILAGCTWLVYDLFLKADKLNGLLLVSTLFCIFLPVLSTVNFSQTNFILLFLLLLMRKYSDKGISGLFLAVAFFTKPYMIVFGLFFLLRMNWKAIIYCTISTIALMGITFAFFGKSVFTSYLFDNPSKRMPAYVFSENVNQSLHAVLIRNNLVSLDNNMTFLYIAGAIFLLTFAYLIYLIRHKLYDYIWTTLLLVGLLIYPGTLSHYGVLMLFIIFQFFDEKRPLAFNPYISIPIIGCFYYLSTVSIFSSICFLLCITVLRSFKTGVQRNIVSPNSR